MSVESLKFRGYAFVAGELAAKHGTLTDDEAEAYAIAMAQAALTYLLVHFGLEGGRRALAFLKSLLTIALRDCTREEPS